MAHLYSRGEPGPGSAAFSVPHALAPAGASTAGRSADGGAHPSAHPDPVRPDAKGVGCALGRPRSPGVAASRGGRKPKQRLPYVPALAPTPRELAAVELALSQQSDKLLAYLERHLPQELRPTIEPADVLQDTYFDAFRRIAEFRWEEADSVYRWLVTIARNRVIDLVRMKRALKRGGGHGAGRDLLADGGEDSVVAMLAELAVYRRTPSRSAAARELTVAVERSVGRLPEIYGEVIRLRYLEGLPVEETARRMGRSPGAIKQLCNRAYKALRVEMKSASMYL